MSLRRWTYLHEGIWSHGLGARKVKVAQHIDSCAPVQHARTSHVQATLIVPINVCYYSEFTTCFTYLMGMYQYTK
jgi:hypothetical protein